MWRHTAIAIKFALITTLLLGLIYPLAITGLAQVVFPKQANGSMIEKDGKVIGSELLGQSFNEPKYFQSRPSAASGMVSGGSNLAPTSKALKDRVKSDVAKLTKENPGLTSGKVPADMATTSASGLDPDITPANAYAQVTRVAQARGISEAELKQIVKKHIIGRQLGVLGEPRINVLKLNLALDAVKTGAR